MDKCVIQKYKTGEIRSVREEEKERWLFSVTDILRVLEVSTNPSRYWSDFKRKLRKKGELASSSFSLTNVVSLKLPASDQKSYQTDMVDLEELTKLLPLLHSSGKEEFLTWILSIGREEMPKEQEEVIWPVLPLLNSSFLPGKGKETVEKFEHPDLRRIAQAELFYFSGEAEKCRDITENYLENRNLSIRLSACMMYSFANFTLGNAEAARDGFQKIQEALAIVMVQNGKKELQANCVFSVYVACVLVHLPTDDLPPLRDYVRYLPAGLRIFAAYLMAHKLYLEEKYERALGILDATVLSIRDPYPIPEIYVNCVIAMCRIKLKEIEEAREAFMTAWEMAKPDGLLEAFIEHHGLLQGVMEACLKKTEPEAYKSLTKGIINFSRGWMKLHNKESERNITDALTPQEFAIAMLACRDWTNQEIADCLGISVNTVKHIISDILSILHVNSRKELLQFVNK